jgi:hypothetical protein
MPRFKMAGPWQRGVQSGRGGGDCRQEGAYKFPGYGPAMWWDIPASRSCATETEELADLRCRVQMLAQELAMVQKRIAMLEQDLDLSLNG